MEKILRKTAQNVNNNNRNRKLSDNPTIEEIINTVIYRPRHTIAIFYTKSAPNSLSHSINYYHTYF